MKTIDTYIIEKLHISKDKNIYSPKYNKGDMLFAVFKSGIDNVCYIPCNSYDSIEEFKDVINKRFDDVRHLEIFLSSDEAKKYELEIGKLD